MWSSLSSLALLLLVSPSTAITFNCDKVISDSVTWNFEKLGGLHQVSWIRPHAHLLYNTTFKIDICKKLELKEKSEKKDCGEGTRICGVEYHLDSEEKAEYVGAWPITREYTFDGAHINPKYTRLKTTDEEDKEHLEGVLAELGGGSSDGRDQKAKINFICLRKENSDRRRSLQMAVRKDDEEGDDEPGKDKDDKNPDEEKWKAARRTDDGVGGHIDFVSYKEDVLVLNWSSPYACENTASAPDKEPTSGEKSGGWGFFSWFFFLIFMLLFAFVAFTAWVNYTRNGARGWDLLPFSDTLRDLPYILGDWSRKIASTLGGGGTRGGYSAV